MLIKMAEAIVIRFCWESGPWRGRRRLCRFYGGRKCSVWISNARLFTSIPGTPVANGAGELRTRLFEWSEIMRLQFRDRENRAGYSALAAVFAVLMVGVLAKTDLATQVFHLAR
jgi:hypothetical protein